MNNTENKDSNDSEFMLTTIDNKFNPYVQWDEWYAFDTQKRFIKEVGMPISTDCCAYLARIAITSENMTDEEQRRERHEAIEEIIRLDPFGIYTKAYPPKK